MQTNSNLIDVSADCFKLTACIGQIDLLNGCRHSRLYAVPNILRLLLVAVLFTLVLNVLIFTLRKANIQRSGAVIPLSVKILAFLVCKLAVGLKTNSKALWSAGTVIRVLKNPIYTGVLIQCKETTPSYKVHKRVTKDESEWTVIEDSHEAIISKIDFDSVQKVLKCDTRRSPGGKVVGLFSGMIFCGDCGASMVRKTVPVINKETAPTVHKIFEWRSKGISVVQIGRRLNDAGILSPSAYLYETGEVKTEKYKGVLWHTQIIKSILAHPVYIGHMVQGRKKQSFYEGKRQTYVDEANWIIVRNTHEPIIDEETFEKVQQIANQRKSEYHERLGKFAHLKHSENILQGLVWCPNCQRPLVRYKNVSHGKKLWYTYICPGHADDPTRCSFVSIREDELNEVLFTAIQSQIQIAADLQEVIKRLNAEPEYRRQRSDAASKLEAARRTLKRSQNTIVATFILKQVLIVPRKVFCKRIFTKWS